LFNFGPIKYSHSSDVILEHLICGSFYNFCVLFPNLLERETRLVDIVNNILKKNATSSQRCRYDLSN